MNANDWFNSLARHAEAVRQQQPVGSFDWWTDQEGQAVLLRRHRRHPLHRAGHLSRCSASSPNFIAGSLASVAATNPAELPLYQQYFHLFQNRSRLQRSRLRLGRRWWLRMLRSWATASGQYQANGSQPGNEWHPQRSCRLQPVRQGPPVLARTHGPRHAGDLGRLHQHRRSPPPAIQPSYDGQGQWTHVFSPNATNQFVYAGSYYRAIFTQNNPTCSPIAVNRFGFNLTERGRSAYTTSRRAATSPSISLWMTSPGRRACTT